MGTPQVNEVYKKGRLNNRLKVFKNGKLNTKPLKEFFPHLISNKALDFIKKCLTFDPDKRLTIDEALDHSIFSYIRDKSEELTSEKISRFDFVFEDEDIEDILELRKLILEEIMLYHNNEYYSEYTRAKNNYNDFMKQTATYLNNSNYKAIYNDNEKTVKSNGINSICKKK